jgi:hypothetical protein
MCFDLRRERRRGDQQSGCEGSRRRSRYDKTMLSHGAMPLPPNVRRFSVIGIDPEDLERAFGHPVPSYAVEPIDPHLRIHSVTGGVYRVRAGNKSLVVKVVRHGADATPNLLWQAGTEVAHRNYWKREWLAFDSGCWIRCPVISVRRAPC